VTRSPWVKYALRCFVRSGCAFVSAPCEILDHLRFSTLAGNLSFKARY
jgi:hypothetical protein